MDAERVPTWRTCGLRTHAPHTLKRKSENELNPRWHTAEVLVSMLLMGWPS